MRKPRAKFVLAAVREVAERPAGPPWHEGRTFYSCPRCSAQSELTKEGASHPPVLACWNCDGTMRQWIPPQVMADQEAAGG